MLRTHDSRIKFFFIGAVNAPSKTSLPVRIFTLYTFANTFDCQTSWLHYEGPCTSIVAKAEDPGLQDTTATLDESGMETFDNWPNGYHSVHFSNFGDPYSNLYGVYVLRLNVEFLNL